MSNNFSHKNMSRFALASCLIVAFLISWYFHDRFWWGPDDAYFGYTAQLILSGEILHKDIPVIHSGLNYLINAFMLHLGGGDLVALRYPLIAITVIQTGLAYKLAEKHGMFIAVTAAVIMLVFSFIQFINPSPNWYTLFFAILAAYVLSQMDARHAKTIVLAGFLVGIVFLLRQLTGVILAVAVTTVIFLANSKFDRKERLISGKIILGLLALSLGIYVLKASNPTGIILIGIYPILILFVCARNCVVGWRRALEIIAYLLAGAIISTIPLAIYYGVNGAFFDWLYGMLIRPFEFISHPMFEKPTFLHVILFGLKELFDGNMAALGGLFFWISLVLAPMILGFVTLRQLARNPNEIPTLGLIASIYSLVAIHFQIPLYLFFCIPIVLLSLLLSIKSKKMQRATAGLILILSAMAVFGQAGQPITRGLAGISINERPVYEPDLVPNTSIIVPEQEAEKYQQVLDIIEKCSNPSDSIYAFPMNPEIYFLSKRKRAFDFIVSHIGFSSEKHFDDALAVINSDQAPALIFHDEDDKYNSALASELLEQAKPHYVEIAKITDWTVYLRKDHPKTLACMSFSTE